MAVHNRSSAKLDIAYDVEDRNVSAERLRGRFIPNAIGNEGFMTGTIRTLRVDKGFGFIKDSAGKDYFFHQTAIFGEGINDLREGDSVEFEVVDGPKGPRAEKVRRTST